MEPSLISSRLDLFPHSLVIAEGVEYGLARTRSETKLCVLTAEDSRSSEGFDGEAVELGKRRLLLCPLSYSNATTLRNHLHWLKPRLTNLNTSAGMGDRLGIATPGHVRAARAVQGKVTPIFAQQSIREMSRTERSPQQVIDDAMWGVFEEGWQEGFGADADHLKTKQDIDSCLEAGFTFFTIDPGQYVDDRIEVKKSKQLNEQLKTIPEYLHPEATRLTGRSFDIEGNKMVFSDESLLRAVLKYGKVIAHIADMYKHLEQAAKNYQYEVEISMDETKQPTLPLEHVYIACELLRLGVKWISFAPRFVGRFEKGVDYIGDRRAFRRDLATHAAIARQLGPYKLSLHSGSDKFSIYAIFMEETRGLAHLKTAGTSYLEALRTIAKLDTSLFLEIYAFALKHFEVDRQSYHISAQLGKVPQPSMVRDCPTLLDQFDAREILHVTFGSVLTETGVDGKKIFRDRIISILNEHREAYFADLEHHLRRHLEPFSILKDG